jgi:hypothetical protein
MFNIFKKKEQPEQPEQKAQPEIPSTYPLTTKEEYLQWVNEWKEDYKKLSKELRDLRIELSKPHVVTYFQTNYGGYWTSEQAGTQGLQAMQRGQATAMLKKRKEMKEKSWKLKQENKSTT